jgi:hypothetical protein
MKGSPTRLMPTLLATPVLPAGSEPAVTIVTTIDGLNDMSAFQYHREGPYDAACYELHARSRDDEFLSPAIQLQTDQILKCHNKNSLMPTLPTIPFTRGIGSGR